MIRILLQLLLTLLTNVFSAELHAMLPNLTDWILRKAADNYPSNYRLVIYQEWLSDPLYDQRRGNVRRLLFVGECYRGSLKVKFNQKLEPPTDFSENEDAVAAYVQLLQRNALVMNPADFQEWAFESLKEHIPFDSAIVLHTNSEFHPVGLHLHNIPKSAIAAFFQYGADSAEQRLFFLSVENQPNTAVADNDVMPFEQQKLSVLHRFFYAPYNLGRGMGFAYRHRDSLFRLNIYLNRKDETQAFTSEQKRFVGPVLSHIAQALEANFHSFIHGTLFAEKNRDLLLCESDGTIRFCGEECALLLSEEWPGNNHSTLPIELKDILGLKGTLRTYIGRRLTIEIEPTGSLIACRFLKHNL